MRRAALCHALVLGLLVVWRPTLVAVPIFSAWDTPVNLGPVLNSSFDDGGPALSKDGRSLYFHSNRPGGFGDNDIWVSQRASVDDPWEPPINLGPIINTGFAETVPTFSRDGHWMFFASTQPGGMGETDIWVSWRQRTGDDFGWQAPVNLGPAINTPFFDAGPAFFEGDGTVPPTLFFISNGASGIAGANDVYASDLRPDGTFTSPVYLPELSSPQSEGRLTISHDGLEVILFSIRPGGSGGNDLWVSTRGALGATWEIPENLGPFVNSSVEDRQPQLSSDRTTLLFASNRTGGFGNFDLYETVRTRLRP
jgi:WD40 repeat protein